MNAHNVSMEQVSAPLRRGAARVLQCTVVAPFRRMIVEGGGNGAGGMRRHEKCRTRQAAAFERFERFKRFA